MAVPISAVLNPSTRIRKKTAQPEDGSLLDSLISRTASGAQYAGETLNKASRALWGSVNYLTGDDAGGGLLNLIPFSDAMGLTDPRKGVELDKFLEDKGVLPKNKPGFDFLDPVRFGAAVGGDPFSWLGGVGTLKALGKGGSILAKASPLAKGLSRTERIGTTVAQLAPRIAPEALEAAAKGAGFADSAAMLATHGGESVGGLLSANLPFGGPLKAVGTGPLAQKVGGALDKAGEAVRFSYPGRLGNALFNKNVMGAMTKEGQQLAENVTRRMGEADFAARSDVADIVRGFHEAGVLKDQGALRSVVQALEGVAPLPPGLQSIAPQVQKMRQLVDDILPAEQMAHLKSGQLNDVVNYFTRRMFQFADRPAGMPEWLSRKLFKTTHPSQIRREDFLRDLTGGTDIINELSLNPQWSGIVRRTGQKLTKPQIQQLGSDIENFLQQRTGQFWTLNQGQGEDLARWLSELDPRYADEGVGVFATNPVENLLGRMEHGYRAIQASEGVRDALKGWATHASNLPFDSPSLASVVEKSGLADTAAQEIAQTLGMHLDDIAVPADKAADILKVMKPFQSPEAISETLKLYDKFTNLTKSSLTTLFPSFHTRNSVSAFVQNVLTGMASMKGYKWAIGTLHGKGVVKDLQEIPAFRGMSDKAATDAFRDAAFATGVVDPVQGLAATGDAYGTKLGGLMPGVEPTGIGRAFKSPRPVGTTALQAANPLNTAGVATAQDVFYPARVGREVGRTVESTHRLAAFAELMRQGLSPQEAAARVKAAHVDYSSLSEAEKVVMKRLFPFYGFQKGMAQFVTDELLQRPGGRLAQTIRATNAGRTDEPLPDQVAQGLSIPLGQNPDGSKNFLSNLGLMHESTLDLVGARGGLPSVGNTFAEIGAQLNPALKYPIEAATGTTLFQRGPLGARQAVSGDPPIGRLISNVSDLAGFGPQELPNGRAEPFLSRGFEQFAANLPTSRVVTTLKGATDTRKNIQDRLLNTLTGAHVTTVSPSQQRAMIREELFALARESGANAFEQVRFTKDQLTKAQQESPDEYQRMLEINALADQLARETKADTSRRRKITKRP